MGRGIYTCKRCMLYYHIANPLHQSTMMHSSGRTLRKRMTKEEQDAYRAQKRIKLSSEMLTLYYNGLDVYSMQHCGEVSVAVQDWWELVCALNPTFWIPEFADNTENLYDIIRTWGDDDATFRRWRNILEKYIQKNADPRKRASFLDSLLGEDP